MFQTKIDINHIPKFDGTYFHVWKHKLTLLFKTKKLWSIVNGTETKPIAPTTTRVAALPIVGASSISN